MFDFFKDESTSMIEFCKSVALMKTKASYFDLIREILNFSKVPDEIAKESFKITLTFKKGFYFRVNDIVRNAEIEIEEINKVLE